jgi:hypothetical protein
VAAPLTARRLALLNVVIVVFLFVFVYVARILAVLKADHARNRRYDGKTRTLWAMFATILFMYSCGVVNFVLELWMFLSHPNENVHAVYATLVLGFATVRWHVPPPVARVLTRMQVFLSDCIVVWRAWVLWTRSKAVLVASAALLLCALGASRAPNRPQRTQLSRPVLFVLPLARVNARDILYSPDMVSLFLILTFAMSVATNLYTTVLVGIRTWYILDLQRMCALPSPRYLARQYWRAIRSSRRTRLSFKIIILLVESGAVYIALGVRLPHIRHMSACSNACRRLQL